jgi:hypothetical protein
VSDLFQVLVEGGRDHFNDPTVDERTDGDVQGLSLRQPSLADHGGQSFNPEGATGRIASMA